METSPSEAVLTSIRQFRLHDFDWDGCGGLPLRSDVADTASDIYDLDFTDAMPMPVVSLNKDGTVDVEYDEFQGQDAGKKLFLTFQCQGVVTYIKVYADGQTTVDGTIRLDLFARTDGKFDPEDFAELTALFDWLADSE